MYRKYIFALFLLAMVIYSGFALAKDEVKAKSENNLKNDEIYTFRADNSDLKLEVRLRHSAGLISKRLKIAAKPLSEDEFLALRTTVPAPFRIVEDCRAYNITAENISGSLIKEKQTFKYVSLGFEYPGDISPEQAQKLVIFTLYGNRWMPLPSQTDLRTRMVKADKLTHFGIYGLFAAPALQSQNVLVYPNPVQFGKFGTVSKTLKFRNVPLGSAIEIYTLTGEKIREIVRSRENEEWDGKKDNGDLVTSGLYIYRIRVAGKDIYGKIAVLQ